MKTYLECIPCFFQQALDIGGRLKISKKLQKEILDELSSKVKHLNLNDTPAEIGKIVYQIVREKTKISDPFYKDKDKSIKLSLQIYPLLKDKVSKSNDSLLEALKIAISGNIIDFGAQRNLNLKQALRGIVNQEKLIKSRFFDYKDFKKQIFLAKNILYLADNAGETVFDRVLLEEIKDKDKNKKIIYAVKEKPIINDALIEDAYKSGIDQVAQIISSGVDTAGTILNLCSKEFLKIYKKADLVISKGQGNFEGLSGAKRSIFFLLVAKCPVIANHLKCNVGEIVLLYNFHPRSPSVIPAKAGLHPSSFR